jgi:hypothetical protein
MQRFVYPAFLACVLAPIYLLNAACAGGEETPSTLAEAPVSVQDLEGRNLADAGADPALVQAVADASDSGQAVFIRVERPPNYSRAAQTVIQAGNPVTAVQYCYDVLCNNAEETVKPTLPHYDVFRVDAVEGGELGGQRNVAETPDGRSLSITNQYGQNWAAYGDSQDRQVAVDFENTDYRGDRVPGSEYTVTEVIAVPETVAADFDAWRAAEDRRDADAGSIDQYDICTNSCVTNANEAWTQLQTLQAQPSKQ